MISETNVETIDPLDALGKFSLDEIKLLETIDPNDLTEWIEDASDSENEEQDSNSIDPDDLKEWLEVMSREDDTELLEDLQQDDFIDLEESSEIPHLSGEMEPQKIDFVKNIIAPKSTELQERIAEYQNKLELTMFKTELSRQQFLKKKSVATNVSSTSTTNMVPKVLNNLNDLMTGKRKCLTSNLEESRKRLKMFKSQPQNPIRSHNEFFTGKRTALTSELEKSRNYLKLLGGLNKFETQRTRLIDCVWQVPNNSNSALTA